MLVCIPVSLGLGLSLCLGGWDQSLERSIAGVSRTPGRRLLAETAPQCTLQQGVSQRVPNFQAQFAKDILIRKSENGTS